MHNLAYNRQTIAHSLRRAKFSCRTGTQHNVSWLRQQGDTPIYEGAKLTFKQAAFLFLEHKLSNGIGDRAANIQAHYEATHKFPSDNIMPRFLHLMKGVFDIPEAKGCGKHVCAQCYFKFEDLEPAMWEQHKDEECLNCAKQKITAFLFQVRSFERFVRTSPLPRSADGSYSLLDALHCQTFLPAFGMLCFDMGLRQIWTLPLLSRSW